MSPEAHDLALLTAELKRPQPLAADRVLGRINQQHSKRVRRALLVNHGPFCWLCGGKITETPTLDHIVPRSKGGRNAIANLRLAHDHCNNARGCGPVPELLLTADMVIADGTE